MIAEGLGWFKDPEDAHLWAGRGLRFINALGLTSALRTLMRARDPALKQKLFGFDFESPVGLAGGFDKEAKLVPGLESLGFGFVEVGGVTAQAQPGNPRQRIFKYTADKAIINRMGLNSGGADRMRDTLTKVTHRTPLGINMGKSKITELADAPADYLHTFSRLYDRGDYFVVNVSSPNTPGLRALQDKDALIAIVTKLNDYRARQKVKKPILVKIAPDLTNDAINDVLEVVSKHSLDGVIAVNTTVSRDGLSVPTTETGGMSGMPLKNRATDVIRHIHAQNPKIPIIGVGGIFTAADAYEKIKAGASLVQLYSGFIYGGPGTARRVHRGLAKLLKRDGFASVADAVGKG